MIFKHCCAMEIFQYILKCNISSLFFPENVNVQAVVTAVTMYDPQSRTSVRPHVLIKQQLC